MPLVSLVATLVEVMALLMGGYQALEALGLIRLAAAFCSAGRELCSYIHSTGYSNLARALSSSLL